MILTLLSNNRIISKPSFLGRRKSSTRFSPIEILKHIWETSVRFPSMLWQNSLRACIHKHLFTFSDCMFMCAALDETFIYRWNSWKARCKTANWSYAEEWFLRKVSVMKLLMSVMIQSRIRHSTNSTCEGFKWFSYVFWQYWSLCLVDLSAVFDIVGYNTLLLTLEHWVGIEDIVLSALNHTNLTDSNVFM